MAYPKIFDSNNIELATLNNITSNSLKRRVNSFYEFNFQCYEEEFKTEYIQFENYIQTDDETFDIAYIDVSNVNNSPYYDVKCEHVFYRLHDDATKKNNYALSGTPTEILTDLLSGTDFTVGTVDFPSNIVYAVNREATVMNIVISLANTLGAEIGFSNNGFTVDLLNTIGQDNGVEVRIKKNIKGISKSIDKRGVDKTSYKIDLVDVHNSEEYKDLTMIETLDIGDTFQLIDETLGINISQSVLEIEKDVIKESITNITTSNSFDLLDDKLSYIEETAVKKDEIIYGIKINEDVGLEIERDDKLARTKLNADEFRMQTGDGGGSYTDALYFDPINKEYIFVGEINASDFVGGTIEIGTNFSVDSNGNMIATNADFSGDISGSAITGGTIDIGTKFSVDSNGILTAIDGNFEGAITGGTIDIGTNFSVDNNGNLIATNADFSGDITGTSISGGTIDGTTITGGAFRTSASGKRIEISNDDFKTYNSSEQLEGIQILAGNNFGALDFYSAGVLIGTLQYLSLADSFELYSADTFEITTGTGNLELNPDGDVFANGEYVFSNTGEGLQSSQRFVGVDFTDVPKTTSGQEIEFQVSGGNLEWRLNGGSYTALVNI